MRALVVAGVVALGACNGDPSVDDATKHAAVATLRDAIEHRYSYRDRLHLDWDRVFADEAPAIARARTRSQLGAALATLLARAEDPHILVIAGRRRIATDRRVLRPPNYDRFVRATRVAGLASYGRCLRAGRVDGYAYVAIDGLPDICSDLGQRWDAALAVVGDAPGLIVDLRANSGGNDAYAEAMVATLIARPVPYERIETTDGRGGFLAREDRVLAPRAPHHHGPVVALIGPRVMSSAESMALMLRAAGARLVGENTGGSSGNPQHIALAPGISVLLPSWRSYRLDGALVEGNGIAPDVRVPTTPEVLAVRDPVLDAAVALLRTPPASSDRREVDAPGPGVGRR